MTTQSNNSSQVARSMIVGPIPDMPINESLMGYNEDGEQPDVTPRIDVIVDLEAPFARQNLNRLLFKLYQDSPYLRIFVNKWSEWDDFSHKDNPVAPRAIFHEGVFKVFLERKLINQYNRQRE